MQILTPSSTCFRFTRPAAALAFAGLCTLNMACPGGVPVSLLVTEPCDQESRVLNDVQTLRVSFSTVDTELNRADGEAGDLTFPLDSPQPLDLPFDDEPKIVTVQGYTGDSPSGDPIAIGRTMPLVIEREGAEIVVPMGELHSFGRTTAPDSTDCSDMDNGQAVNGRHGHSVTYLPSIQMVLVLGGALWIDSGGASPDQPQCYEFLREGQMELRCFSLLRSAELYDPATGKFYALPEGPLSRAYHEATLLGDGRVLITGGFTVIGGASGAELQPLQIGFMFDPAELTIDKEAGTVEGNPYSSPIDFQFQRAMHTATYLPGANQVALIGGCGGSPEFCTPFGVGSDPTYAGNPDPTIDVLKDPTRQVTDTVQLYDVNDLAVINVALPDDAAEASVSRALHAASVTDRGFLVVSGGVDIDGTKCNIEVFQATNATLVRQVLSDDRANLIKCPAAHAQLSLGDGNLAIIGGASEAPNGMVDPDGPAIKEVQFWSTTSGRLNTEVVMLGNTERMFHKAFLMHDDSIIITGGLISDAGATSERLVPASVPVTFSTEPLPLPLSEPLAFSAGTVLPNNQVFISGGYSKSGDTSFESSLYFGDCRAIGANPGPECVN